MTRSLAVLITGATDGLGPALAERLAADGTDVILHGRNQAKLNHIADQFAARGASRPRTVTADLADLDQVRRMAAEIHVSVDRLDVLVME
ncbi:short-subunit dehydrogenase [Streptacidiphilus sp. MAP12-16]|uniref:SDR family NAD(P)-dependent oxidoreductase n=1 Tax=Streptacidiphilus sp. MAP12-16 TaxID=3156300 RepID=UPI003512E496